MLDRITAGEPGDESGSQFGFDPRPSRGRLEKPVVALVHLEQRLDFLPERGIAAAGRLEKNRALRRLTLQRLGQYGAHLPPALGSHSSGPRSNSRLSQSRATRHWRLTVAGDTSSTSAVSSMLSPAKYRSSTRRLCSGSSAASRASASSSASTSTSGSRSATAPAAPQRQLRGAAPALRRTPRTGVIHEDRSHRLASPPKKCARLCHATPSCPTNRT